jgi:Sodium/hydrogen exchanger family
MEFRDLLLGLVLVWLAAKVAGEAMERIGQTAVLGELLAGVLIGPGVLGLVHESGALHALAELGVLILLFEVGLEHRVLVALRESWSPRPPVRVAGLTRFPEAQISETRRLWHQLRKYDRITVPSARWSGTR